MTPGLLGKLFSAAVACTPPVKLPPIASMGATNTLTLALVFTEFITFTTIAREMVVRGGMATSSMQLPSAKVAMPPEIAELHEGGGLLEVFVELGPMSIRYEAGVGFVRAETVLRTYKEKER